MVHSRSERGPRPTRPHMPGRPRDQEKGGLWYSCRRVENAERRSAVRSRMTVETPSSSITRCLPCSPFDQAASRRVGAVTQLVATLELLRSRRRRTELEVVRCDVLCPGVVEGPGRLVLGLRNTGQWIKNDLVAFRYARMDDNEHVAAVAKFERASLR